LACAIALTSALVALVLASGAGTAQAQSTAQTWEVQVGGGDTPTGGPPFYEAQAYGPDPVIIRVGDTVTWTFMGAHTVTFNAGRPDPVLFMPGPGTGEAQLGPGYFPIGVTDSSMTYDGSTPLSTGFIEPGNTFSLTFTKPGNFGYVCTVHPGMRGMVEVREAGATLPESPAQAKTRGQVTLQTIVAKTKADVQMVRPVHAGTVHVSLAGLGDGFGGSALLFVNANLTIRRGDTVVWTNADPYEIHTVTFPGDATPPEIIEPRPQQGGPPILVIPANVASPVGGDTYRGAGYANSGIFGVGGSYALSFNAPPGAYQYLCVVHPWMVGTITVTE
jgi:plastocyanin